MVDYSPFTKEEWTTLQFSPLWMFTLVAGADERIDEKEFRALVKELAEAMLYREPLVQRVFLSVATDLLAVMQAYKDDPRDVLQGLKDTARVLSRRVSPEQANNFKKALLLVGQKVAEASGGGLFGGEKVSDQEKAALVLAAMTLGVSL